MEDKKVSLINSVPSFARGSDILLVHSETLSLGYIASLLRQCGFKVMATNQATAAIDIICQQEGKFKLVMAKANMSDMSTLSFLNTLHQKNIPVIFFSSGENDKVARAALERGLCCILEEPFQPEDLIQVLHQVYYPNNNLAIQIFRKPKSQDKEASENQNRSDEDVKGKKKRKRSRVSSHQMNLYSNHHLAEEEEEEEEEARDEEFVEKRPRITWTPELHNKFVHAISILGEHNIRPKEIQQMMNVPHLTCRHIASHLQKFKTQVRYLQEMCNEDISPESKSSNFSGKNKSSSSFESQSYPEYPTLASFQNEIQNQNQFKNSDETQEPEIFPLLEEFQSPTELINYENQDLYAVVGGVVSDASRDQNQNLAEYNNNTSKFLGGEDDDTVQNSELVPNNSISLIDQNQNLTAHDDNSFRFLGEEENGQNSEILRNSNNNNNSCLRLVGEKCDEGYYESEILRNARVLKDDASMDYDQTLAEYNDIKRIFEDDFDDEYNCFGNEPSPEDIAMLRDAIFGDTSNNTV